MDLKKFRKRLRSLYSSWAKHKRDRWCNTEVLVIGALPSAPYSFLQCPMSSFFYQWLFGRHCPGMVAVFSATQIHFLCNSNKKPSFPKDLNFQVREAVGADLTIHFKGKDDKRPLITLDEILQTVSEVPDLMLAGYLGLKKKFKFDDDDDGAGLSRQIVVGCIAEEKLGGEMLAMRREKKGKAKGLEFVWKDVTYGLSKLLRISSEKEAGDKKGDENEEGLDSEGVVDRKVEYFTESEFLKMAMEGGGGEGAGEEGAKLIEMGNEVFEGIEFEELKKMAMEGEGGDGVGEKLLELIEMGNERVEFEESELVEWKKMAMEEEGGEGVGEEGAELINIGFIDEWVLL